MPHPLGFNHLTSHSILRVPRCCLWPAVRLYPHHSTPTALTPHEPPPAEILPTCSWTP
ncbi:hypothetical protein BC567DRAFT_223880 [Phyllosticta citribraziliensis]